MPNDEPPELNYDSEDSALVVFSAKENDLYRDKKSLLGAGTRNLFDTLCLVRCRSDIPKIMLKRFSDEIGGLLGSEFVCISGSPPSEAYLMAQSQRRWNCFQLRSNQVDLQAAFGRACGYYQGEIMNKPISQEDRVDLVEHVEALAVLYEEKGREGWLVANRWFASLLWTCARICREDCGAGGDRRAERLGEIANFAQQWTDVDTL